MKKLVFILLVLSQVCLLYSQEKENIDLLVTEDSWRKEAFRFPMLFAQEVNFDGVADVRFTKGWEDKNSPNFWSYAFAWKISIDQPLSELDIENYMQLYFDGLMNVVKKDKSQVLPATLALFSSLEIPGSTIYKGKISFHDAFFTEEMMILNVQCHYTYCSDQDISVYKFKLSPKPLDSTVWQHINKVMLRSDICE